VTRAFVHHFVRSVQYLVSRPMAWFVVPVAAGFSFLAAGMLVNLDFGQWQALTRWAFVPLAVPTSVVGASLVWLAAVAAVLPSTSRVSGSAGAGNKWTMPALPISPRVRVVAEVAAALSLIFVVRLPLCALFAVKSSWPYRMWIAAEWDLLLGFPVLAGWVTGRQRGPQDVVRLVGVYGVLLVGFVTALVAGRAWTTLLPLAALLSVGVVYSIGRERTWIQAGGRSIPSEGLHRPPVEPERRFRRDVLWRSLPLFGLAVVPGLTLAVVVAGHGALIRRHYATEAALMGLVAVMLLFGVTWISTAVGSLFPLRIPLVNGVHELFVGRYCASWSCLPVRREAVRRLVYANALLMPLLVATGLVLFRRLVVGSPAWLPKGQALFSSGLAVACWAGWALCVAVGDRVRGILAGTGAVVGLWLLLTTGGWSPLESLLVVATGLFAVLPLAHLRRPRRVA
jgi:hypothetical protein